LPAESWTGDTFLCSISFDHHVTFSRLTSACIGVVVVSPDQFRSERELAIRYLSPDELTAHPMNAREHGPRHIRQLMRSIQTFGFISFILVDANGVVIAGHGRLEAAKRLKRPTVPVVQVDHLTAEQVKAYMLTDNRLAEVSRWNEEMLTAVFKDLTSVDLNFDIEVTGFSTTEIDLLILDLDGGEGAEGDDEVPAPNGPPISELNDLFELGNHRLLCASALVDKI
jgi:ParB-like chromosome segregation protein Spo0J